MNSRFILTFDSNEWEWGIVLVPLEYFLAVSSTYPPSLDPATGDFYKDSVRNGIGIYLTEREASYQAVSLL